MDCFNPPSRPSFRSAISRAERQVEYRIILHDGRLAPALAHEICMIMAEVYMMNPEHPIRISGEWLDGHVVQQVFGELTRDHVEMVIEEFCRLTVDRDTFTVASVVSNRAAFYKSTDLKVFIKTHKLMRLPDP